MRCPSDPSAGQDNQVAGARLPAFESDLAAATLRIRDQLRSGSRQVSDWTLARRDVDVPLTRNVTRSFGDAPLTTLRPANLDLESRGYDPIDADRQRGRQIEFAEAHGLVLVDDDTYGVRLTVETTFLRGSNPCRSPRITRGHWESR